jgi:uncharacterized membrane protein
MIAQSAALTLKVYAEQRRRIAGPGRINGHTEAVRTACLALLRHSEEQVFSGTVPFGANGITAGTAKRRTKEVRKLMGQLSAMVRKVIEQLS